MIVAPLRVIKSTPHPCSYWWPILLVFCCCPILVGVYALCVTCVSFRLGSRPTGFDHFFFLSCEGQKQVGCLDELAWRVFVSCALA